MLRWRLTLFSLFLLLGLLVSHRILSLKQERPAVLADVVNSATVVSPTPSPTSTLTPTPTPRSTARPTTKPVPTTIAYLTPTPIIPPTPTPEEVQERYYKYSLFGYTSGYADVRLEGIKLIEGTKANKDGYFEFINFSASNRNLEFCLTSVDTENLVAMPLCVPVPIYAPERSYGPYLLPPTLRLSKGNINTSQTTVTSGKTIPGANVNIYVFSQPEQSLAASLIKPAYAQSAAQKPRLIKIKPSSDGSFSTRIYGDKPGKKRVFSQSSFTYELTKNQTPKSVTLTVNILNVFLAFLVSLMNLLRSLFTLNFFLFLQALIVAYLLIRKTKVFNWYILARGKRTAIVVYRQKTIVKAIINYCPLQPELVQAVN